MKTKVNYNRCFPQHGDRLWADSPEPGHPKCLCSRCNKKIRESEHAIRIFIKLNIFFELRYCRKCVS